MKIIFGADGNLPDAPISKRFGHAVYYLLFNSETNNYSAIENLDKEDHDHKNLAEFQKLGVEKYVVGNIGPHAFSLLADAGAEIYLARGMSVRDAAALLLSGKLKRLSEPTVKKSIGHHD
ncbi:MAG: dinitrogenase iron-molybdenum cofactor biosynthesis protein [Ignavibacteriales bacterium]|nr:dinitrogenase iron-molybdenum cofactor biosynthesis protein [Ignavibacteriales bacterium]MCF8306550.1 dinitrogenase iron-molybdenum cofactor biosynthesis protein [Ignavibacteriales bacterium]MCF8316349.1 dinitrogenase iron-molybdenum cofactor biosynthesis protein [Ignavibacteriales bacterium]MCF8437693.1 dinitrogenase iron-molybdenum cofactor biosynthesis protein [Ignavibacteriales bacterium]